ncbi:hypothetical protein SAMN05192558_101261 [Actinokineospora alba]|uniref:Uncharacterized protein n=1 Tax=Actinokineospora alba TaxID=504798 RepID=A0A1H0F7I0_9PSEU|nr:hypothetical protein [Actinokineospora alba]TDP69371.1 hypothetical protein C8E96_4957 [Actinokineospora alba]SDI18198.1 hypothetical protein SAMN05421871_103609 [Actinokineospora alba]SDN90556.1 hypothetical protein SAMN05192558_101261 [Actinokineospora alba]
MQPGDIDSSNSPAGVTERLETLVAAAARIWNGNKELEWTTVLADAKRELGIDEQDKVIQDLVDRLTYRGAPRDEHHLVGKAELAVRQTVERRFGRQPTADRVVDGRRESGYKYGDDRDRQRLREHRDEQDREQREQLERDERRERRRLRDLSDHRERELREHRAQRERRIVAPPAALGEAIHAAKASIHVSRKQPLSGQRANKKIGTHIRGVTITGFKSVSPPEQIPFEYQVDNETFTGTAIADHDSQLPISNPLTFCTKMHVVPSHAVDRVRADFTVSFDRQVYYVTDQAHGEINGTELPRPRRFANLTLRLISLTKQLPDDSVILDLSVETEQNKLGAIIYYINWSWTGHLWRPLGEPKTVDRHGAIKLNPNGQMFAEDEATQRYFNLPRS